MTIHKLKCDPTNFEAIFSKHKRGEIRFNDRGFEVGDTLHLLETKHSGIEMKTDPIRYPLEYTERSIFTEIAHIQFGYGLMPGWVVLSFSEYLAKKFEPQI